MPKEKIELIPQKEIDKDKIIADLQTQLEATNQAIAELSMMIATPTA